MRNGIFAAAIIVGVVFAAPVQAQPLLLGLRAPQQQAVPQNEPQTLRPVYPGYPLPPSTLVLPAGTIITVEALEMLSSNKQHEGDIFVAELQNPLVVDGWVVARPGQNVMGRIAAAKKAGRVKGTSELSLELQQVILVDGRQMPVQSELVDNSGGTSHGRDAAAVAISTGIGAAVGAICGAKGAAIGAAAGAGVGLAGVLLTRGEETQIGPERLLTFRLASPLTVSTEQSRHAFWQVTSDDYIVPEKVGAPSQGGPVPIVVSQPYPRRVPISVAPEAEVLSAGRPGRRACGN